MHTRTLAVILIFGFICSVGAQNTLQTLVEKMIHINGNDMETARKKKKGGKYTMSLFFAFALLMKSIIFPLAFKGMAVMTGIAVLLSTMSLIISSIVGYAKVAVNSASPVKVIRKMAYTNWAKDDNMNTYNHPENYGVVAPPPSNNLYR